MALLAVMHYGKLKMGNHLRIFKLGFLNYSWEQRKLSEICSLAKGQQLNKLEMLDDGSYYVLNGGINPSGYTEKWNVPENTISISEGGNSCGYVNYNTEKFWSGGHNYTLSNLALEPHYLYQYLKSIQSLIMSFRVGSGLPNIQKNNLNELSVFYPREKKEQADIGSFFANLDSLITLHQRE